MLTYTDSNLQSTTKHIQASPPQFILAIPVL